MSLFSIKRFLRHLQLQLQLIFAQAFRHRHRERIGEFHVSSEVTCWIISKFNFCYRQADSAIWADSLQSWLQVILWIVSQSGNFEIALRRQTNKRKRKATTAHFTMVPKSEKVKAAKLLNCHWTYSGCTRRPLQRRSFGESSKKKTKQESIEVCSLKTLLLAFGRPPSSTTTHEPTINA